jgi:hypothetical protein
MDDLFERPLWTMYKHAYPTEDEKTRNDVLAARQIDKSVSVAHRGKDTPSVRVEEA